MQYIYAISDGTFIKVGISKHPERRLKQLNTGSSSKLYLLGYFEGDLQTEKQIHSTFRRIQGEWMEPTTSLIDYLNTQLVSEYILLLHGKPISLKKIKK